MSKPRDPHKPAAEEGGVPSGKAIENKKPADEEVNGRGGLDPVRYGDWEIGGRCVDF